MADTYRTFKRSCTNWQEFATARKITVERGLSYSEAYDRCQEFEKNLTPAQKRKGTRMEFERER